MQWRSEEWKEKYNDEIEETWYKQNGYIYDEETGEWVNEEEYYFDPEKEYL